MPPSETTSEEKRPRAYWPFVLIVAVVIVAAAFIFWPRAGGRQQLSLTVLGYSTNWGTVSALVAVTNKTKEAFVLGSVYCLSASDYVFRPRRVPSRPSKLLPGQGSTLQAPIWTGAPCKVGVEYLNDGVSARIWQKLPFWLMRKLLWAPPWRTATTEVINLSRPLK